MNQEIRIRLSAGLIAVAAIHALLLAGVFEGMHHIPQLQQTATSQVQLPTANLQPNPTEYVSNVTRLQEPAPSVNADALGEKKQQGGGCINCPQPTLAPPLPVSAPAQVVSQKPYQLAVFIGRDAKSQQLLGWVNSHPKFQQMKNTTDVQVYSSGDLLYQRRYASVIRPDQFPAIVLTDQTGGHIHAAGGPMLPDNADALYADCVAGAKLYLEAKRSAPGATNSVVMNGAIKSRGYNWDQNITPSLQLLQQAPSDCPDGYCRPVDRIRDVLFDDATTAKQAVMWLSSSEMLVIAAVGIAAFILWKRNQA